MKKNDDNQNLEAELSKRMAGEVYPELLRLMKRNSVNSVTIQSIDRDSKRHEPDDRFIITVEGITDCESGKNPIQMVIETMIADIEYEAMDDGEHYRYPGEAEDEGDDGRVNKKILISDIDVCPILEYDKSIDYVFYCEQVVSAIESLLKREQRVDELMGKIDRIPYRKKVIIEKYRKDE